jgi:hypothetical protein
MEILAVAKQFWSVLVAFDGQADCLRTHHLQAIQFLKEVGPHSELREVEYTQAMGHLPGRFLQMIAFEGQETEAATLDHM